MSRKVSKINRLSSWLIGWNTDILSQCGESSYMALRKYTAGLFILSFIWGTIGYCISTDYLGFENLYARLGIALVFVFIVFNVEKYIILGNGRFALVFRIVLGFFMAVVGSIIMDKYFIRQDIDIQMQTERTKKANIEIPLNMASIEKEIDLCLKQIDSLDNVNAALRAEYEAEPTKTVTDVIQTPVTDTDANGGQKTRIVYLTFKKQIESPKRESIVSNDTLLNRYRRSLDELKNKKFNVEAEVRDKYDLQKHPAGFLEELDATIEILSNSTVALVVYLVIFAILLSLELLIVLSKYGEKPCDYELLVKHQLKIKSDSLS